MLFCVHLFGVITELLAPDEGAIICLHSWHTYWSTVRGMEACVSYSPKTNTNSALKNKPSRTILWKRSLFHLPEVSVRQMKCLSYLILAHWSFTFLLIILFCWVVPQFWLALLTGCDTWSPSLCLLMGDWSRLLHIHCRSRTCPWMI